jgi:ribose transport system substrate-binding protein
MMRLATVVLLVLCLLGAGCTTTPTAPNATPPSVSNASLDFTVVPPAMTSPFYHALVNGTVAAGTARGWRVDLRSPASETDHAAQAALLDAAILNRTDMLAVSPINGSAITGSVRAANTAGIPVFMFNLITPVPEGEVVEYIGYDQYGGAKALGTYACRLLATRQNATVEAARGEVFVLRGVPGFHANRRTDGFKAGIAVAPNVTVVGEECAFCLRTAGEEVASRALAAHPNLSVFYATSDEMAIGAIAAIEKSGRVPDGDVLVIGIDGNPPTLELIRDGRFTATLGVYPERMGAVLVDQAARHLAGGRIPRILHTPWTVVDRTNLEAYVAGDTWTTPTEGAAEHDNGRPTGA